MNHQEIQYKIFLKSVFTSIVSLLFLTTVSFAQSKPTNTLKDLQPGKNKFQNPIIPGFNPDPSICRVGNDFYLVTSTFEYFPGVPVYHSTDLVNWKLIGHALDRPSQLNLDKFKCSLGIFAPTIRYNNGTFYMVTTIVGPKFGNFVVTAENPAGPWSEPHWIKGAPGIDPSLFFDDDGKVYMSGNITPKERVWNGHNNIWLQELDIKTWELKGERTIILDGADYHNKGTKLDEGSEAYLNAIEAAHIYKKDGYYYHLFAHGGTGHNHAVAIMRSKNIRGPYELDPNSPILTHRDLSTTHPITTTGHADLVDTKNGDWWMVYLGKRPNDGEKFMLGRETFLSPVDWSGTWPIVNPKRKVGRSELVQLKPKGLKKSKNDVGDFYDDFSEEKLNPHWTFKRTPHTTWWSLTEKEDYLSIKLRPEKISEIANPSFLGKRMAHFNFMASTKIDFNPDSENEEAGLVIERDRDYYIKLTKSKVGNKSVLKLAWKNGPEANEKQLAQTDIKPGEVQLKVIAQGFLYRFSYSLDGKNWIEMEKAVDCRNNDFHKGGKWTGSFVGIYASSNGEESDNKAFFDWFEYKDIGAITKFNLKTDLLLAQYDSKTDADDLHSIAAFATLLNSPEFPKLKYHAVAGAYGTQGGLYVPANELFEASFGKKWSDAHTNFEQAVNEVTKLVLKTLARGGDIWIAEAGQSDFTWAWLKKVQASKSEIDTKSRIHLVQHGAWNEQNTASEKLAYVKIHTDYHKIPDGNGSGNGTPGYRTEKQIDWRAKVTSPKSVKVWEMANALCEKYNGKEGRYLNEAIYKGGFDFSDMAEISWILSVENADNVEEFFEVFGE